MDMYTPLESDWKLFRQRLPQWQENHMKKLCDEYAAILTGEQRGSEAFWEIEKRIRRDKERVGVIADMRRSLMYGHLWSLLEEGVITPDDLTGFSEELKALLLE